MASDHLRASDTDRDAVVSVLRDAYAVGRLTLEEFDERTSAAYASKTWGDLRALTRDLPERLELGADLPDDYRPRPSLPAAPRLDADRVLPAPYRRRPRLVPIFVLWAIAGLAAHSLAVTGALVLVGFVLLLGSLFASGWREEDERRRGGNDKTGDSRDWGSDRRRSW
jgi:hypothetical protein